MKLLKFNLVLFVVLTSVWLFGPRDPFRSKAVFDRSVLPANLVDLDDWLVSRESAFDDITPGAEKQIVWADAAAPAKTPWSVVYLHGFSATAAETRPMPDDIASALRANLFFTRLRGHGRGSDAMLEGSVGAWMDDTAEALEIGRRLGDRLLVIGVSTGGTLAALAAADEELSEHVAGWMMVSPNFAVKATGSSMLRAPWASAWVPLVVGETRSWDPLNEEHGRFWTTTYSNRALFPMAASVEAAAELDVSQIQSPALFVFSDKDHVVDAAKTRELADNWGGEVTLHSVELGVDDDPFHHVIAGDILSPGMTDGVVGHAVSWAASLPQD